MASPYEVEVSMTSAKDLKNVNWRHGKLTPHAVVWVDPTRKCSTHVDEEGDTSPNWNEKLIIPFTSDPEDSTLHVDIVHANADEDTKPLIGSAKIPVRDVIDDVGMGALADRLLHLKRPSGRPHGKLELKVCVRNPRYRAPPEPYPPPMYGVPQNSSRDYAAAPYGGYYGAPPASGQPAGYYERPGYYSQGGYYGQAGQGYVGDEKKNKFGGMGTGLAVGAVAGVLGGVALAEGFDALEDKIADDVADRVEDDLGYDGDD